MIKKASVVYHKTFNNLNIILIYVYFCSYFIGFLICVCFIN